MWRHEFGRDDVCSGVISDVLSAPATSALPPMSATVIPDLMPSRRTTAPRAKRCANTPRASLYDHHLRGLPTPCEESRGRLAIGLASLW